MTAEHTCMVQRWGGEKQTSFWDRAKDARKECGACVRLGPGNLMTSRQAGLARRLTAHPCYPLFPLGIPAVRRRRQPGDPPGVPGLEHLPSLDTGRGVGDLLELIPDDCDVIVTREGGKWAAMAKVAEPLDCARVALGNGDTAAEAIADCLLQVWPS